MKIFALLIVAAAWVSFFIAPKSAWSRVLQLLVFGLLGAGLTLVGGFSYWWDSGMRPSAKSPFILVCGVLTLASQASTLFMGVLEDVIELPRSQRKFKRRK